MVALVNQANNKEDILSIFSQFCHRTVNDTHEIAHKLLGEKFVGQIDVLRQMMQKTINTEFIEHVSSTNIIENVLQNKFLKNFYLQWFTPEGFKSLLALVGTNGQGIGTSAFSRWVKNVSALELPREERIQVDKLIDRIYDDMEEGKFSIVLI